MRTVSFWTVMTASLWRSRRCLLSLEDPGADRERLAAYLALVDRPMAALLARDRLEPLSPGRFLYRSRSSLFLGRELRPTLELQVSWDGERLQMASRRCRIAGLGRWEEVVRLVLSAELWPGPSCLEGEAAISLELPQVLTSLARPLIVGALDLALERIELRLQRGLRRDLLVWLMDPGVSG
jgi:hypothetical protein